MISCAKLHRFFLININCNPKCVCFSYRLYHVFHTNCSFQAAALAYIIFALCNKGETSSPDSSNNHDKTQASTSFPYRETTTSEKEGSGSMFSAKSNVLSPGEAPASEDVLQKSSSETSTDIGGEIYSNRASENCTVSWKFLSKQHWPELLSFYHIRFHERCVLLILDCQFLWQELVVDCVAFDILKQLMP